MRLKSPKFKRRYVNRLIKKILNQNRYIIRKDGTVWKMIKGVLVQLGAKNARGYMQINSGPTHVLVHRLVYAKHLGQLNSRLVINHKDGNKTNNNIENLEQVTKSANVRHSFRVLKQIPCASNAKFTQEQIKHIRELHAQGKSYSEIMKIYPMSKSNVSYIINNVTWSKRTQLNKIIIDN